jgi:GTP-binding protein
MIVNPNKKSTSPAARRVPTWRSSDSAAADAARSGVEWIEEDELVEVTPKSIRLRKEILDHSQRKVANKKVEAID